MEYDEWEVLESEVPFVHIRYMVANDCAVARATYYDSEVMYDIATATGSSKRVPGDKFDKQVGIQIAAGRALEFLGLKLQKRGFGKSGHNDQVKEEKNDKDLQARKAMRKEMWLSGELIPVDLSGTANDLVEAVSGKKQKKNK